MFCERCGHKLQNNNDSFCPECGNKISNDKDSTGKLPKKRKIKNKKLFVVGVSGCFLLLVSIILFTIFYDPTKISWDLENGDSSVTYTQSTTLTLNVLAYDKDKNKIDDIEFSTKDGIFHSDGASVKWQLPKKAGSYTIVAKAPRGKKIKKTVTVVNFNNSDDTNKALFGVYSISDDENADTDGDGLKNVEEIKLGTDPDAVDTDKDGLSDYYEINVSKTNPLLADTDDDGVNDGDELDLGLDPLKDDSKGDGIKDNQRSLKYSVDDKKLGVLLEINGKGNIASSTIDSYTNSAFSNSKGLIDKIYNFYTNGIIEEATVKINYNLDELKLGNLNEDKLTLYYFDENTKQLVPISTTVDKDNKQIIAKLDHFSKYVIGDSSIVSTNSESRVMFVIDNSVSMYSTNQMINAGYNNSTGAIGNDTSFKRLTLTNKLVDMFTGNYKFGVAEFSGNYVNLQKFSDDRGLIKQAVYSMKSKWSSNANGTNIVSALKNGISEFSPGSKNNYLILLTDGKNTSGSLISSKNNIVTNANKNNVKICVIGIGNNIDTNELNQIATSTGCNYYNATDSSALDEIYSLIGADINYNYVDTDNDNEVDGMIQANSGFLVNRDGFSFANFSSNKSLDGHCYGMATFAMLYYKNELPLSMNARDNSKFYLGEFKKVDFKSNGYNLKNTYFSKHNRLYDFKISDPGLSILLGDQPGDYRDRIEDSTWMIKKDYYDKMANIGVTFSIKDYNGKADFTKYQSALLNIDNDVFNKQVKKEESQLIDAIWRLFITQARDKKTTFAYDRDKAFNELVDNLSNGTPQVITINGNHAINAIRLIQNTDDSNQFKIEVYDNNYPGQTRYINMVRSKLSKIQLDYLAWVNDYNYTFTYDSDNDGVEEKTTVTLNTVNVE